jgi:precorrin-3B C17-methyltransferase / cobalt-factor III methyltransferase
MVKENNGRSGHNGPGKGAVYVVGIGPGGPEHLTERAVAAIAGSNWVVGYTRYIDLVRPLVKEKNVFSTGMTHEVERCRKAIDLALDGNTVSVVSSGDSGIYGMAGLIFEIAFMENVKDLRIEVVPGIPAFVASAAILGAPLMHDFASISLSDLLTDRAKIEERIEAAVRSDFVIILYNPKSSKRREGLERAIDIVRRYRGENVPVGIVRNATRSGQEAIVTSVGEFGGYYERVDMLSIIIIGNSQSFAGEGRIITPRGYKGVRL